MDGPIVKLQDAVMGGLTAHHSSLGSCLPAAVMDAEGLNARSCHLDEQTYIARQIDHMRADLDNLAQAEEETKQQIQTIRVEVRNSQVGLNGVTECKLDEDVTGVITVG
jgi:hypothetical protein